LEVEVPREVTQTVLVDERTESLRMKRFLLTIESPGETPRHRIFGRRLVTFGSSPDNDVVVDDPAVSRRHCEIRLEQPGYRLIDTDSKNGTFVGDLRVHDVFLRGVTSISLGATLIRFETTDEEVEVLLSGRTRFGGLVGASSAMRELFATLERVSSGVATILIEGAPGTGKEQAAQAVHAHGPRKGGEFVVFDCSSLSDEQVEPELFGDHEAGDHEGAGALELAATGTLYLVDPADLSPELQAKLCRALEQGEYRRQGASQSFPLTARLITGSERSLLSAVERGEFREDLYYQLAVVRVALPPLRERPDDVPLLVEHFLAEQGGGESGAEQLNVTYATMERLKEHLWPGNVAELRNFIARAIALASPDAAAADSRFLRPERPPVSDGEPERAVAALMGSGSDDVTLPFKDAKARLVEAFERAYWTRLLEHTSGNVSAAARVAGVHRKSVEYILRKHELSRRGPGS